MPTCPQKEAWFAFFNQLSNKHTALFKNVNGGVFMSAGLLEMRNTQLLDEFRKVT